ncbi:hypothetical protein [Rhizobium sp. Leaf386]|uniref:hypothetical protein n=1 Tax=Rhizobium sp. Leaf386 TaxID=1736359 RepID=UPI0012E13DB5|nr:hypothetical protein [Rhizobium sp. Leaf386]
MGGKTAFWPALCAERQVGKILLRSSIVAPVASETSRASAPDLWRYVNSTGDGKFLESACDNVIRIHMVIENGGRDRQALVMQPDITLSLVTNGVVARPPLKLTFAELEQRMVVDFQCSAERIRAIFKQVEEHGSFQLVGTAAAEVYLIEKILAS